MYVYNRMQCFGRRDSPANLYKKKLHLSPPSKRGFFQRGFKEQMMRRTTVMIPEDLKIRAAKRANSMGLSLGGFIRESIERALKFDDTVMPGDHCLDDKAAYDGDTEIDLAKNHDHYLYGRINSGQVLND